MLWKPKTDKIHSWTAHALPKDRLKKLLWKTGTMLFPVPAVLVCCGEYGGVHNIITIAWTGVVCTDSAVCSVSIRPERFAYELIRKSGEFAINLTTAAMAGIVDWCGVKSGREFNKFREMKLTPLPAKFIRSPLIRYYGNYANAARGKRKKLGLEKNLEVKIIDDAPDKKTYRRSWAQLIYQVYEVDPLKCPKCGAQMKIIAFIQEREVIIRILKHLAMWLIVYPKPAAIDARASPLDFKLLRKLSV